VTRTVLKMKEAEPDRELVLTRGPDPLITGKPNDVRVRFTSANGRLLITVEASWSWDPKEDWK
jgi:hypothetical protein